MRCLEISWHKSHTNCRRCSKMMGRYNPRKQETGKGHPNHNIRIREKECFHGALQLLQSNRTSTWIHSSHLPGLSGHAAAPPNCLSAPRQPAKVKVLWNAWDNWNPQRRWAMKTKPLRFAYIWSVFLLVNKLIYDSLSMYILLLLLLLSAVGGHLVLG